MNTTSSIIVIVTIILLIYVIIRLVWMKQYKGTVMNATTQQVINSSELQTSSGTNECTYSIWIYIDNWNDFYGEKKIILTRGYTGSTGATSLPSFELYLDEYGNNLIAKSLMLRNQPGGYDYVMGEYIAPASDNNLSYMMSDSQQIYLNTGSNTIADNLDKLKLMCGAKCDSLSNCVAYNYGAGITGCYFIEPTSIPDFTASIAKTSYEDNFSGIKKRQFYHTCEVSKIPTQKWVNVIVSISSVSVDMYMNGKLIKTCLTNGTLMSNDFDVILSPNGVGFTGSNARFQYWAKYITPKDAWKIYTSGYQKTFDIGQYSLSFGIYKGDVKKTSITI